MRVRALTWAAFVVLACAAYALSLTASFQSDDHSLIAAVRAGGPFGIWSGPGHVSRFFFRPVSSLSLYLDQLVWGDLPFGYHLTNVVLHGTNAFLVARLAEAWLADRGAALAAGLFFLVSPTKPESVAWIAGRTDVIAATFGLAALLAYLAFARTRAVRWLALALVAFFVGSMAKESLLGLPLVVLAHVLLPGCWRARAHLDALAFLAAAAAFVVVRRMAVGDWVGGYGSEHLDLYPRMNAASLGVFTAWSVGLAAPGTEPTSVVATLALAAVVVLVVARAPHGRPSLFLACAFFLSLLSVLTMIVSAGGHEGERFVYWSSTFAAIWLARAMWTLRARRLAAGSAVLAACVLLAGRTAVWRRASLLCDRLLETLTTEPHEGAIVVVNVPDTLDGAAVFRNGLGRAVNHFYDRQVPLLAVVYQRLWSAEDDVAMDVRDGALTVTSPRPGTFLRRRGDAPAPDTVTVTERTDTHLAVAIEDASALDLYVFSRGDFVPLVRQGSERAVPPGGPPERVR